MVKISKILETIISQATFDTMQSGCGMLKDHLMLAILRYEGTFASSVLQQALDDWQIYQIALHIERALEADAKSEVDIPEIFFPRYLERLAAEQHTDNLSTLNAVIDIIADPTTASSKIFKRYGLSALDRS
ncbi:MAG: hypothetical protein IIV68_06765 [Alistipes sp.]|nr:hypothetical protein [Alistipes sp.]